MGKIVKYCSSCDEGFAEKFGFCPDCGAPLQAFEMNPVGNEMTPVNDVVETSAEPTLVDSEIDATPIEVEEPEVPAPVFLQSEDEVAEEIEEPVEEVRHEPTAAPAYYQTSPMYADETRDIVDEATSWDYTHADDGGYYITVIQEKNGKQRNMLLLGAAAFMTIVSVGAWGVSLFQKALDISAIGNESSLAYLIDEVPMQTEEEQQKKDKDKAGGGGGGGGKEDPEPVNQGDLPDQTKNPLRPPDPNVHRADFELKMPPPSTEGNMKFEKKYNQWGDPNSLSQIRSSGPGSGGGMGTGIGTGAGSGSGTGTGSGSGSGYGSGDGDGNGSGTGSGTGGAPPPAVAKVTTPYKIISKPRPGYTDAARANQVTGTVALKVTLLASGAVGSIVPVRRLPDGLTEQAIAAARQIRFEPKKVNGVPQSISVTIEYSFTIY